jgi:crotonobetainyl-CoA:carnitine CoA-transferase CaiB-like acyl-CoA transferase
LRQLLSDISVLELSAEPAGAYCAKVFADLGADVIKVETGAGDPSRRHPERFVHLNTNKRSVVLALDDDGRARLLALVARADLVIESTAQGDLDAFATSLASPTSPGATPTTTTSTRSSPSGPRTKT